MLDMSILARYKYNKFKTDKESKKSDKITILLTQSLFFAKNTIKLAAKKTKKDENNLVEEKLLNRFSTLENILLARDL
jgi:hypothetical protein